MQWLGNIVISIAVPNLDKIYSGIPIDMISPLTRESTITVLENSLMVFDSNASVLYHEGRTIIVEMYGVSNRIDGIRIDSCLDANKTEIMIKNLLNTIQ